MSAGLKCCTHSPRAAETRRVKAFSVHSPCPRAYCVSILTLAGLSYLRTRRWRCLPMWPAVSQMIHHHRCGFIIGRSPRAPRSSQISGKCQPSDECADWVCHEQWALCQLHAPKPKKSNVGRYVWCVCVFYVLCTKEYQNTDSSSKVRTFSLVGGAG